MPSRPNRYVRRSIALAIAAMALLLLPACSLAAAATLSGTVTGQSSGGEAKPLAEVKVAVGEAGGGEILAAAKTDAKGGYSLEIPPGVYDVHFEPPSGAYEPTTIHKLEAFGSQTLNVLLLRGEKVQLTGTIRDHAGNPVPYAQVAAAGPIATDVTEAGADGVYSIAVQPGSYKLIVENGKSTAAGLPTHWNVTTESFSVEADRQQDITLPPTSTLTVQVLGKEGEPVAGAQVNTPQANGIGDLGGIAAEHVRTAGDQAFTGSDGKAKFVFFDGGLPEQVGGIVPPSGSPYGYANFKVPAIEGDATVVVSLPPLVQLTGTIRDHAGNPVPYAQVAAAGPIATDVTEAGADGVYSIAVQPGSYKLIVENGKSTAAGLPTHWNVTTESFSVEADRQQDITLPPTSTLTVQVLGKEGEPVAGAQVNTPQANGIGDLGGIAAEHVRTAGDQAFTGSDGKAKFVFFDGGLPEQVGGIVPPSGSPYGYANFKVPAIEGDATVVVSLPPLVQLTGTIRDHAGNPVPYAQVAAAGPIATDVTEAGADGVYSIAVQPGSYKLIVENGKSTAAGLPTHWNVTTESFSVEADRQQDITLPPTSTLTVQVLGKEGEPVAGAQVNTPQANGIGDLGGIAAEHVRTAGDQAFTGSDGKAKFVFFDGGLPEQVGGIVPPSGSPYGYANFKVPAIEGDATVVVSFAGSDGEEEIEDTEAPQIHSLAFEPTEIDTGASEQQVTVVAHITDNLAGSLTPNVSFRSPSSGQDAGGNLSLVSGSTTDGIFEGQVTFRRFSETGVWRIQGIALADQAGNNRFLNGSQAEELGFPTEIVVNGEEDTEAPQIHSLAFEPTEIDTGASEQQVTVVAHITDNLAGSLTPNVSFRSPSSGQDAGGNLSLVSGSTTDGIFEGQVTFRRFSETGVWRIQGIALADQAGNNRFLNGSQAEELGFPTEIVVNGEEDTEAPQIHSLAFEPTEIDTGASEQQVTVVAHITDNLAGSLTPNVSFRSPSSGQDAGGNLSLVSGSTTDGIFEGQVTFRRFSETGVWRIQGIALADQAGNNRFLNGSQAEELGFPTEIVVNGEGEEPKDTTPPQLLGLTIEPDQVDTSVTKQAVAVTAQLADESGLKEAFVLFESPNGESSTSGAEPELVAGSPTNGSFRIEVTFDQGSEVGAWNIAAITLLDKAGNEVKVPRAELEGAELPHTVTVVGQPPSVAAISPSSGPEAGGAEVTISGSGFGGTSEVRFGSAPAAFEVVSGNTIAAISPAGTGTVDVTVTTPAGTSETSAADRFAYGPPVSLSSSPNPSVHGQKVTFTSKVEPQAGGAPTPLGTVAFVEGGTTLGVANLKKGIATFNISTLGAGKHQIAAVYSGDSHFGPSGSAPIAQTVTKVSTEVILTSSLEPAPFGSQATLKANVKAIAPGAGTPAGTVTFREGESVLATVQLSGANATYSLKALPLGEHPITASYSGDANNEPSQSEPLLQTIVRATTATSLTSSLNPAPSGAAGNLTATVDAFAPSIATPTGSVVFSEGEAVLASVPLTNGIAKYPLKLLDPGTHQISVSYAGGTNFEPSGAEITQVVVKADTQTTVTSSLNPAPYGSSGTVKATVKAVAPGTGTPMGNVTFSVGETVLATVPLSSGTAKYAFKSLPPSEYPITVTYGGDPNFEPSDGEITQTIIQAATLLTLTSSKNPAPTGSTGSIKATVKALTPGTGQPPGTVTFRDGETVLATVPLSSGSASYPLKSLTAGTHEITASYAGSANYTASEGAITQVIAP